MGGTLVSPFATLGAVAIPTVLQGRRFGPSELEQIRRLIRAHPSASRYRLSRELALAWDWRSPAGQLKDMAARTLLLKLQQRGWIQLPARRWASPTRSGRPRSILRGFLPDTTPIEGSLRALGPIVLTEVTQRDPDTLRRQLECALEQYHYLGYRSRVGENLQYWATDAAGRPLGCVVFGAAAWQCAARDRWIGWDHAQRARALGALANNTRLLVFPWVRVPHLASHLLAKVAARIGSDWQAKYRHPIHLLESFVDRDRFLGTCYRAANWVRVGHTCGRGRQGPSSATASTSIKELYLFELHSQARQLLCA